MATATTSTSAALNTINAALHDRLVTFTYPAQGKGEDVTRTVVFKKIDISKRGSVYIGGVELKRAGERHECYKNWTLAAVSDFELASFLEKALVFIGNAWVTLKAFLRTLVSG